MKNTFKILEIIWLIMGCIGIVMSLYSLIVNDNKGSIYFLAFTAICGIMYLVRKRQRVKYNSYEKQNELKKQIE